MPTASLDREATQSSQPGRTGYLLKMTNVEMAHVLPAPPGAGVGTAGPLHR